MAEGVDRPDAGDSVRAAAAAWNLRRTGMLVRKDAGEIALVLSDGLRAQLDRWKADRDERWPGRPRPAGWRDETKRMTACLHDALAPVVSRLAPEDGRAVDRFLRRYDLAPLPRSARPGRPLPPDRGGLRVVSAIYGKGERTVDVTKKLASRIVGGRLAVRASNSLAGDPAVGVVKKLTVNFVWRGRRRRRSVAECELLTLP
jgi:hypothetical protein